MNPKEVKVQDRMLQGMGARVGGARGEVKAATDTLRREMRKVRGGMIVITHLIVAVCVCCVHSHEPWIAYAW